MSEQISKERLAELIASIDGYSSQYAFRDARTFADTEACLRELQERRERERRLLARIAQQQRELEKDAARYRWLRVWRLPHLWEVRVWRAPSWEPVQGDELDAAIDAAIGKGERA